MNKENIDKLLVEHQKNFLKNLEVVLSGFIHDINNPIAVISGQSSIMKTLIEMNKLTDEKALKGSTKILKSTHKMGDIIQRLRDFYRPSAIDDSNADVKLAINTIYNLSTPKIFRNDLQVNFTGFKEDENIKCLANPLVLNLVFWNIHYLCLDTVEDNSRFALSIKCANTKEYATIEYTFNNGQLIDDYLETSEMRVALAFANMIGAEIISSSSKEISIKLKLII